MIKTKQIDLSHVDRRIPGWGVANCSWMSNTSSNAVVIMHLDETNIRPESKGHLVGFEQVNLPRVREQKEL